jgi:UMF1 family MFS transporter
MKIYKKGAKKLLNAWAFYDWANSVYPLVISTAIFPIFYGIITDDYLLILGYNIKSTALITYISTIAFFLLVIITPILSGIADYTGNKKFFMKLFCYIGSFSCVMLYNFNIDNLEFGLFFYFIALIGFWCSLVFYNSYLPDIARESQQDYISAKGYSMGYVGSVILLFIIILMVNFPDFFSISSVDNIPAEIMAMKYSFVMVGIWWFLFSQYSFYQLPGRDYYLSNRDLVKEISKNILFNGFKELLSVWIILKKKPVLKTFLLSFFIYSIALQTVILVATYFGESEVNWSDEEKTSGLIVSILIIQLIAVLGSILAAFFSKKIGNLNTLIFFNLLWSGLCIYGYFVYEPIQFYIAAAFVGFAMGGIQSLSRSTFSKFLPKTTNTTSFFSFYDVAQKLSIVIGTFLFATIDQITGSMRSAIMFFLIFFLLGAIILIRLNTKINKNLMA